MNRRFLLATVSVLTLAFPALRLTQSKPSLPSEHTELEEHMDAINDLVRGMRKSVGDEAARDESLAKVVELQGHVFAAKQLEPSKAADMDEATKAEFMTNFRKDMVTFLKGFLDVEAALLESRFEDAAASFKEMQRMKNPSHKKYKAKKKG